MGHAVRCSSEWLMLLHYSSLQFTWGLFLLCMPLLLACACSWALQLVVHTMGCSLCIVLAYNCMQAIVIVHALAFGLCVLWALQLCVHALGCSLCMRSQVHSTPARCRWTLWGILLACVTLYS